MKKSVTLMLLILLAIFCLQNLGMVQVSVLTWTISAPRAAVYVFMFLLGMAAGFILKMRRKKEPAAQP